MLFFFFTFIHQRILKKLSQVSSIYNKSALHKMHFKVYTNFDQINAVLMTISDLQKYKIFSARPCSDWQIYANKNAFSDFWVISYCFVYFAMLIIIQTHFVLTSTTSLLFVWEGHLWIILKTGRDTSPQSPPFCTCLKTCTRQWYRRIW